MDTAQDSQPPVGLPSNKKPQSLISRKNIIALALTALILAAIPLTSLVVNQTRDPRSAAQTPAPTLSCLITQPTGSLNLTIVPGGSQTIKAQVISSGGTFSGEPGAIVSQLSSASGFKSIKASGGALLLDKGITLHTNYPIVTGSTNTLEFVFRVPPTATNTSIKVPGLAIGNIQRLATPVVLCGGEVTISTTPDVISPTSTPTIITRTPTPTVTPTVTGDPVPTINSFTVDKNYTGSDAAGQTVTNGCITTGPQTGTAAVRFAWNGANAPSGYLLSWATGRHPTSGNMPAAQTSQVISGWNKNTNYTANLTAYGVGFTSKSVSFLTNVCETSVVAAKCATSVPSVTIAKGSTGKVNVSYSLNSGTWAPGYRSIENRLVTVGAANQKALIGGGQSGLSVSPAKSARLTGPRTGTVSFDFFVDNVAEVQAGGTYRFNNLVLVDTADNTKVANCATNFVIYVTEGTVTIQGRHVDQNGRLLTANIGQRVTLSTGQTTAALGSWYFNKLRTGTYTVTAANIPGYRLAYAYTTSGSCYYYCIYPSLYGYTNGNTVTVNLPQAGNYADIYFRYTPVNTLTPTVTVTPTPTSVISPSNNLTVSTDCLNQTARIRVSTFYQVGYNVRVVDSVSGQVRNGPFQPYAGSNTDTYSGLVSNRSYNVQAVNVTTGALLGSRTITTAICS